MSEYEGIEEHCKAQSQYQKKKALYKKAKMDEILMLAQDYAGACVHLYYAEENLVGDSVKTAFTEREIAYLALVEYLEEEL